MTPSFLVTLIDHDEVTSTSDLARTLVLDGQVPLPLAVRARRQTRGRGRGSNVWWSDDGSLLFTLALDPAMYRWDVAQEARLALTVAVGIVAAIESVGPVRVPLGIRWPNDVEAGGQKLAGILPERVETAAGPRVLVGVGVNVTTRLDQAPAAVQGMATSVALVLGIAVEPVELFTQLLVRLPRLFDRLASDDPALAEQWAALDTLRGQPVRVKLGERIVEGAGGGIDAEGALLVTHESGVEHVFGGQVLRSG